MKIIFTEKNFKLCFHLDNIQGASIKFVVFLNSLDTKNEKEIESEDTTNYIKEESKSVKPKRMAYSQMLDTMGKFRWRKDKRVECLICKKDLFNKDGFNRHFNRIHRLVPKSSARCKKCGKIYTSKQNLDIHTKAIHKGIRFQCEICEKTYSTLENKRAHIKSQHGGKY